MNIQRGFAKCHECNRDNNGDNEARVDERELPTAGRLSQRGRRHLINWADRRVRAQTGGSGNFKNKQANMGT